jgi:hypothetical protein
VLRRLIDHDVDFVVIGGLAGNLLAMTEASGRAKDTLMATGYRALTDELKARASNARPDAGAVAANGNSRCADA